MRAWPPSALSQFWRGRHRSLKCTRVTHEPCGACHCFCHCFCWCFGITKDRQRVLFGCRLLRAWSCVSLRTSRPLSSVFPPIPDPALCGVHTLAQSKRPLLDLARPHPVLAISLNYPHPVPPTHSSPSRVPTQCLYLYLVAHTRVRLDTPHTVSRAVQGL